MNKEKQNIWFPAKKYGYGWGFPNSWQGWAVLLLYLLAIAAGVIYLSDCKSSVIYLLVYVAILTFIFIFICWKKGEKLKWHWGNKE